MKNKYILSALIFSILLFTGCSFSSSPKYDIHTNEGMVKYVYSIVDEEIEYIGLSPLENSLIIGYEFKLVERDINFKTGIKARGSHLNIIDTTIYTQDFYNNYEEAIITSDYYLEERAKIALQYNIIDKTPEYRTTSVTLNNYEDINTLPDYIIALDELYAFKEKDRNGFNHVAPISIWFESIQLNTEAAYFSPEKKDILKTQDIYDNIVRHYLFLVDLYNHSDDTIPQDIWDDYYKKNK